MQDKFELKVWNIGGKYNGDELCKKYAPYLGIKTNAFNKVSKEDGVVCRYYTCYGGENGQFAIEYENRNVTSWVDAEDLVNVL